MATQREKHNEWCLMRKYSFSDKKVLVTGASGGLGSALVRRLAAAGARLAVTSRSEKALGELIESLPSGAPRAVAITADLAVPGEAGRLGAQAVEVLGGLDVLVNNAGVGYFATLEEAGEETMRRLFEVNTFAPIMLAKTVLPALKAGGSGRIINIVSCAGRVPIPTVGVYGGSKSALAVMANTMRLELAPSGIDIVNVYPGTAATAFEENALREGDRSGLCPRHSCGLPRNDMAEAILAAAAGPPGEAWLERQGKWMSVAALIAPGYVDRRLAPVLKRAQDPNTRRKIRLVQVESSLACNLRCIMCPWTEIRDRTIQSTRLMAEEVWAAVRKHLDKVRSVDFTGGGEPLLQPNLPRWIAEAKTAGCETGLLTNGLLLDRPTSERLLEAGLDWLCVSLDGATREVFAAIRQGADFDLVCENLRIIAALRQGKKPRLMINFVLMQGNHHQLEAMVRLSAGLGVDQLNFKQCDVIRGQRGAGHGLFAARPDRETDRLEKSLAQARALAQALGLTTTAFAFTPEELPVCAQDPRDSLFVRCDGQVAPCINLAMGGQTTFLGRDVDMPVVHYGVLPKDDLMALFYGETCGRYRERFQQRVDTYRRAVMEAVITGNRTKALENAARSLPAPLEGCGVCHYLYNI